jgi:uncharacterized protein (DUF58 family)
VYPNVRAVSRYELLAAANRAGELGIRRRRQRGEGLEFHQLREYRQGDSLRQIDWKATARLRRAVSREYEEERDQQIVFLLDCGRKMHARDGALSHFDHALDALLLLAHVALRQGDAVGLLTFGGAQRWMARRKGAAQLDRVMNSVYDRDTTRASDYPAGAQTGPPRQRRRGSRTCATRSMSAPRRAPAGRRHLCCGGMGKARFRCARRRFGTDLRSPSPPPTSTCSRATAPTSACAAAACSRSTPSPRSSRSRW